MVGLTYQSTDLNRQKAGAAVTRRLLTAGMDHDDSGVRPKNGVSRGSMKCPIESPVAVTAT